MALPLIDHDDKEYEPPEAEEPSKVTKAGTNQQRLLIPRPIRKGANWMKSKCHKRGEAKESTAPTLLSLPRELREMIWSYAVGDGQIHITTFKDRYRAVPCQDPVLKNDTRHSVCLGPWEGEPWIEGDSKLPKEYYWLAPKTLSLGFLGMMQTCAKM